MARGWTAAIMMGAAMTAAKPAGAAPETGKMTFAVFREGSRIGTHSLTFTRTGPDTLSVEIAIDLKVELAFVTLFKYRHRNETHWRDGRLVRMDARTNDNGTRHRVRAERTDAGKLRVTTEDGTARTMPGDTLPSTYWMRATVEQQHLLNTQKGTHAAVTVEDMGRTTVPAPAGPVPARGYRMRGDIDARTWYDDRGRWVSLEFRAEGSTIRYKLIERSGFLPTSPAMSPSS